MANIQPLIVLHPRHYFLIRICEFDSTLSSLSPQISFPLFIWRSPGGKAGVVDYFQRPRDPVQVSGTLEWVWRGGGLKAPLQHTTTTRASSEARFASFTIFGLTFRRFLDWLVDLFTRTLLISTGHNLL